LQRSEDLSRASTGTVEFSIIVPTLNEEESIGQFLKSIRSQSLTNVEIILVDGGSQDGTAELARSLGAEVFVLRSSGEFEARNYAVLRAKAPILIFSCADVIFPSSSLLMVRDRFRRDSDLVALTGPAIPYDGGTSLRFIYGAYNVIRFLFSKIPNPLRAFSSSTNFLVVRRAVFVKTGGFKVDDVNADGMMGAFLVKRYPVSFDNDVPVFISGRRASKWGIARFGLHYLYVLENFFPRISGQEWFKRIKISSRKNHREIHTKPVS
jgi:glycosyltransferase involved in cell wall biosynthesis